MGICADVLAHSMFPFPFLEYSASVFPKVESLYMLKMAQTKPWIDEWESMHIAFVIILIRIFFSAIQFGPSVTELIRLGNVVSAVDRNRMWDFHWKRTRSLLAVQMSRTAYAMRWSEYLILSSRNSIRLSIWFGFPRVWTHGSESRAQRFLFSFFVVVVRVPCGNYCRAGERERGRAQLRIHFRLIGLCKRKYWKSF